MAKHLLDIMDGDGDVPSSFHWDALLFQSAKNSIIFRMMEQEKSPHRMAFSSLLGYYKGISLTNSREVMTAITKANLKQVEGVAKKYFCPLFLRPTPCAACVSGGDVFSVMEDLLQCCGKKMTVVPPLENSSMANFMQ
ncbi:hypothetical protein Ocin01_16493 [Orchesella cincta]|uniref:Uncharacterized protein n=1 Tax=Orchesella cincta TaxID=48709 RepID=A0A1D2MB45_ORCCI|nr:hypothetical protein Ocin01_16493 [Orchesella cincta]